MAFSVALWTSGLIEGTAIKKQF
uniref:Uncharacterized protein n=1 Tax=Anguilla anguilla TaxID=7936 RepID=A0A0E9Q0G0_ANGAN